MRRRIDLNETDYLRLMWVFGIALGVLPPDAMPIARQQIYDLTTKVERESVLVRDDDD